MITVAKNEVRDTTYPLTTNNPMARWPRHVWTTLFTYLAVFLGFPLLCWLAYAWVRGWLF